MFLRQATAQTVLFGPCLDKGDGVTEETALTLVQGDMRLSKDGGAFAQKNAAGNATHDSDGWYNTSLDATDTATVGELVLNVHQPANMLPVWKRWWVIEEAVYDALYGAAAEGPLQATTAGRKLDITTNGEAGIDWGNIGNQGTTVDLSATTTSIVDTATAVTTVNGLAANTITAASINANAITEAKIADNAFATEHFATGAITADTIAADAIGASELAADAVIEIADGIWDRDATSNQDAGSFGEALGDPAATGESIRQLVGEFDAAAAVADPSTAESIMQYVKQIVNLLAGSTGIVAIPAAAAPASGVNVIEMIRAIYDDTNSLDGTKVPDTLSLANIKTQATTAISDVNLDHFVGTASGIPALPAGTYLDLLQDDGAQTYSRATDSLQAIRDHATTIKTETASIQAETTVIATDTTTDIPGTISTLQTSVNAVPLLSEMFTGAQALDTTGGVLDVVALVNTSTDLTNLTSIPTNWLTAAGINADAITAAKVAPDVHTEGANAVWDDAMVETTGAPAVTGTFRAAIQWIFALNRNKMTQTSTTSTLRNDADDGDLSVSTVSDSAGTATRGEWGT